MFYTTKNLKSVRLAMLGPINKFLASDVFVAGGAMRTLLGPDTLADYDLFFKTPEARDRVKAAMIADGWNVSWECPQGKMANMLFDDGLGLEDSYIKVQLITPRYYNSMEDLLQSFDFTATLAAFDGTYLVFTREWVRDNKKKRLVINNLEYPLATMRRITKYVNRGYWANEDFYRDLFFRIRSTPMSDDGEELRFYID